MLLDRRDFLLGVPVSGLRRGAFLTEYRGVLLALNIPIQQLAAALHC
jgi:hypothetical protein